MVKVRIKRTATRLLGQLGLYERFKASCLYDFYWSLAEPGVITARTQEVEFYRGVLAGLRPGDLIFDVGANQGYKTDIFLRLGARVVAVDPDPANHKRLAEKFLRYRVRPRPVRIVRSALSDRAGVAMLWMDSPGSGKNTLSSKWVDVLRHDHQRFDEQLEFGEKKEVETTTLDSLVREHGTPFFVKIDVEGFEVEVLGGLSRPVRYLSFEMNLPEFAREGERCVSHLNAMCNAGEFNYAADCKAGLALGKWLPANEFINVLRGIQCPSVEVFWRTAETCGPPC